MTFSVFFEYLKLCIFEKIKLRAWFVAVDRRYFAIFIFAEKMYFYKFNS